jgi:hypothetical protein
MAKSPNFSKYLTSKAQARSFLKHWEQYLRDKKYGVIYDAIIALKRVYPDLDSLSFLIACASCSDSPIQLTALSALGDSLLHDPNPIGIKALFSAFRNETNPLVRGAALNSLGYVAHTHKIPRVKPLLLALINDRTESSKLRLNAYLGLIQLTGKTFYNSQFSDWKLSYDEPLDGQIDWEWIKELESPKRKKKKS